MDIPGTAAAWFIGTAVALLAIVVWLYNGLIRRRNIVANALSQISVQLQRRHDLIPNLVETVKGYMGHERATLDDVIRARGLAVGASSGIGSGDPASIRGMAGAEAMLEGALGRLMALAESYPDLKADRSMATLQEELSSSENRVAFARQAYNDAVLDYNNARETFPGNLVAGGFGFEAGTPWELEDPAARQPAKVSFGG